jgi:hypothetical protein
MDSPEGSTRKQRQEYIKLELGKIFPSHIIFVSRNITYFMQSKKGSPLVLAGKKGFKALVYAPRAFAVPRLHNFICFSPAQKKKFGMEGENGGFVTGTEILKNTMLVDEKDDSQEIGEVFSEDKVNKIVEFITVYINKYNDDKKVKYHYTELAQKKTNLIRI